MGTLVSRTKSTLIVNSRNPEWKLCLDYSFNREITLLPKLRRLRDHYWRPCKTTFIKVPLHFWDILFLRHTYLDSSSSVRCIQGKSLSTKYYNGGPNFRSHYLKQLRTYPLVQSFFLLHKVIRIASLFYYSICL